MLNCVCYTMIGVLLTLLAVFLATAVALCVAEFVLHRPVRMPVPSIYWAIAKLGFSGRRPLRRAFRYLFCNLYRKRFWNPTMNSLLKVRGFDRQRHLSTCNIHAACSAMMLTLIVLFLYAGWSFPGDLAGRREAEHRAFVPIAVCAAFELAFNTPAIILSRYLYLLSLRRPDPGRTAKQ